MGIGILSYAEYAGPDNWSTPTDLAVHTLPPGVRAQVPGFETWFRLLDEKALLGRVSSRDQLAGCAFVARSGPIDALT
ncbi:hypothetical protein GCM10010251_26950 [Streptomyces aurantiogriseus]|uniref:Uncharacterized protein n=1 Tax=Streptomyces aurantiogriseus TaxID=66870 RepID=A0A918C8A4_9ACTN|nr:hypothetical protein GCM10010251_26950 [Streptomyces aurantiogriseus]